jgi:hypothetical protein
MAKPSPHPLWDIEHNLSRLERSLNIWDEETPPALRREFRKRISEINRLCSEARRPALEYLAAVVYPMRIAVIEKVKGKPRKTLKVMKPVVPSAIRRRLFFQNVEL